MKQISYVNFYVFGNILAIMAVELMAMVWRVMVTAVVITMTSAEMPLCHCGGYFPSPTFAVP